MTDLPIGQLIAFGFEGTELCADSRQLLSQKNAGGVVLFKRNITSLEQVVALNASIMSCSPKASPPLICVDQEGGRVQRLKGICTTIPPMRVIGDAAKNDPDLPYRMGAMMGRELAALGFNVDFTPIMDVDTNPANPVIGDRSFSPDAHVVGRMGAALIRGMQGAGIAACAKHFPGHGDTNTDSHFDLPVVNHDVARLNAVEFAPFRDAIAADVASIMTAHIVVPALDSVPATLSAKILQDILRKQLGFAGVIFSDDLNMRAIADRYDMREILLQGLHAGIDVFLICQDTEKSRLALETLTQLYQNGDIPTDILQGALARVAELKRRFIGTPALPDLSIAKTIVTSAPHLALMERAAA